MTIDRDILLDADGDLASGPDGDLATVAGDSCLAQDLGNRLVTPRGSLAEDRDYGFDLRQFLHSEIDDETRGMIAEMVAAELGRDERLDGPPVAAIATGTGAETIRASLKATVAGRPLNFTAGT